MPQKFTQITKTCETCGKEFKVILCRKNTAKFCSHKCRRTTWNKGTKGLCKPNSGSFKKGNKSWNEGLRKETDSRLKKCGENISKVKKGCKSWNEGKTYKCPNISKANKGRKASKETVEKHKKNMIGNSRALGRRWKLSEKTRKSMSKSGKKGKDHYNWKGGITKENNKIRASIEIKFWREKVFKRDSWTCQKTGIKGGVLRGHHIQNFADFLELRFAIDNGITLSDKAHRKFHKIYGKKNNTREQLKEFLIN